MTPNSKNTLERRVELRMHRQKALDRGGSLRAIFVMDEAVLHREIGGPAVMLRQLLHLRKMADTTNIEIRIVPFARGAHLGLRGSFAVLEFPSPDNTELAFIEHQGGCTTIDVRSPSAVSYVELFWSLEDCSASVPESSDILDRTINRLAATIRQSELA